MTYAESQPYRFEFSREFWIVVGVAFVVALVLVFVGLKIGMVHNPGDPYMYKAIAVEYAEHGMQELTRRGAMLYPHLMWLIFELGGNETIIQVFHVLFHVGSCAMVFYVAERIFGRRTALLAGLATTLHPMVIRYVGDFHNETMLVFMTMATVVCAVRFHFERTFSNGILLGVVGMLGALTKGVVLPVLAGYCAFWLWQEVRREPRRMQQLVAVLAVGVAAGLTLTPWAYRNYQVTGGHFVPFTPGTPDAFLRGYIFTRLEFATLQKPPYTDAENESNALFRRIAKEAGTTWEEDEIVDDQNNKRYMMAYIKAHPLDTVRKFVVGLFTFWYEMTSFINSLVPAVLAVGAWTLAAFGFRRAREEKRPFGLVLAPILLMNVFVAALIPLGRYSVPIIPLLATLAAFGVDTLLKRYWDGRRVAA